jgi:hypothetical protein
MAAVFWIIQNTALEYDGRSGSCLCRGSHGHKFIRQTRLNLRLQLELHLEPARMFWMIQSMQQRLLTRSTVDYPQYFMCLPLIVNVGLPP